jgi:hypothetical protein
MLFLLVLVVSFLCNMEYCILWQFVHLYYKYNVLCCIYLEGCNPEHLLNEINLKTGKGEVV